jgi:hypothetical protein
MVVSVLMGLARGVVVIMAVRGAVGMHMIVFVMGMFAIDSYFTGAATARGAH